MATFIRINREYEEICVPDDNGEVLYRWFVQTDDASIQATGAKIASALDRFMAVSV